MRRIVLILIALVRINAASAQINESDTARFQLQLRSGGSLQTGNVEFLRVTNQLDLSARIHEDLVFKTQNNHFYQKFFGNKADDDFASRNYLYLKPQNKIYPYAIGFISTNFRRGIDLRAFTGLGVTYQLVQKPANIIKLSSNLLYEKTTFKNRVFNYGEFDGMDQMRAFWSTLYLSGFQQLKKVPVRITYELYWQQSLEDQVNFRYHLLAGAEFIIYKGLSIQSRAIYAFENVVVGNVQQRDFLWTWGLIYQFRVN